MVTDSFHEDLEIIFSDEVKHKAILHQLYIIEAFLLAKVKNRVSVKVDSRYPEYFQSIQINLVIVAGG